MFEQQPINASAASFPTPADLKDLQGDIVLGFPKRAEDFIFLTIQDVAGFKNALKDLKPLITSTAEVQQSRSRISVHKRAGNTNLVPFVGTNIAFSAVGLHKLGIAESLGDDDFDNGQFNAASDLGDTFVKDTSGRLVPDWLPAFKSEVDALILIAGDCKKSIAEQKNKVDHILGRTVEEVLVVEGVARPDSEKGHEHFGYLDGISSPAIEVLTGHLPGQQIVEPGVLILGQRGDEHASNRPSWAKNGSFLVYRHLTQLVPEFNKFVNDNPIVLPGLDRSHGSDLLGARMVGRWKSGAPIDVTPTTDDKALGNDPKRNNNFDFSDAKDQSRCPFSAHIRKTNPRSDLQQQFLKTRQIMRQGIPFGPEVSPEEAVSGKTADGISRGLAFVCYQSIISNGFSFLQEAWANAKDFPPKGVVVGFDPIIGQQGGDQRLVNGLTDESMILPEWVVSKGGEYFFSPPISALTGKLAA